MSRKDLEAFLHKYANDFGATALLRNLARIGFRVSVATNTLEYAFTKRLAVEGIWGRVGVGRRVLSVGFGDGLLEVNLAARGAHVWGLEIDPDLVRIAGRLAQDAGLAARCRFLRLRGRHYTFQIDVFDVVLFSHSLHDIADPKGALRECYRVLRPRGEILVLEDASEMEALAAVVRRNRFTAIQKERLFPAKAHPATFAKPVALLQAVKVRDKG